MPHVCTDCSYEFEDGSEEMFNGCPDCGGKKFQFKPDGDTDIDTEAIGATQGPNEPSGDKERTEPAKTEERAARPEGEGEDSAQSDARKSFADPDEIDQGAGDEEAFTPWPSEKDETDTEQDVADQNDSEDNLIEAPADPDVVKGVHNSSIGEPDDVEPEDPFEQEAWEQEQKEQQGVEELKEELNRQFGSIKVVSPGEYKVDLMGLFEGDQRIIALQEDGQYLVDVAGDMHEPDD